MRHMIFARTEEPEEQAYCAYYKSLESSDRKEKKSNIEI